MTSSRQSRTIASVFAECKRRPDDMQAIKYSLGNGQWKTKTWKEYVETSEALAAFLASHGVKKGDRVAIMSNTRWEWAATDLANLTVGVVSVPIYQSSTIEDILFILQNSESSAAFVEDQGQYEKLLKVAPNSSIKTVVSFTNVKGDPTLPVVNIDKAVSAGKEFLKNQKDWFKTRASEVKIDDLATIVYTSGTTGVPKGVMLLHSCIVSECEDILLMLDIGPKDCTLTFLPFAHIFGRVELFMHVYVGWTMAYAESIDKLSANLPVIKPTVLLAVPRVFEKVYARIQSQANEGSPLKQKIFQWAVKVGSEVSALKQKKQEVSLALAMKYRVAYQLVFSKLSAKMGGRIRFFVSGGAPLSREIAEFFHAAGILVLEGYGLTETTAAIFVNTPYKFKFGAVGLAVGDTKVKIADDGEVLVKSGKVMAGYFKNPEATRESLTEDGWFHTGDIGELDSDGFLKITDRKKDLIKTAGGKMIAPQKIENVLKTNKLISQVVVYGDKMKYLVALVTLNPEEVTKLGHTLAITEIEYEAIVKNPKVREIVQEIVQEKNSILGSYETIKNFAILSADFTIESGELTPSMKIKRKFLNQKFEDTIKSLYADG